MRILYLSSDPGIDVAGRSGGSVHIRAFVRALAELGHEVAVVSSKVSAPQPLRDNPQASFHEAPLAAWNRVLTCTIRNANDIMGRHRRRNPDLVRVLHNLTFYKAGFATARQFKPDLVYERYSLWSWAGARVAKRLRVPHVLEVNAPLVYEQQRRAGLTCPRLARSVERVIWRKPDLVVTVSESLRADLERAGVASSRIHVLPNAADPRLFRKDIDGEATRRALELDGRFVVGFVGTFKSWHGVDLLIQAFRELHRDDASAHLLLLGHGPLRAQLEQGVAAAGIQGSTTFTGSVPHEDVPRYIAAMDVAVAPAPAIDHFYYSPLKLFEYMAMGRPVVAARVGQVAEIIADGVTGLLFEPGDRGGLVECLRRLHGDAELRRKLGRNAALASCGRTWTENAARVLERVEPLLGSKFPAATLG